MKIITTLLHLLIIKVCISFYFSVASPNNIRDTFENWMVILNENVGCRICQKLNLELKTKLHFKATKSCGILGFASCHLTAIINQGDDGSEPLALWQHSCLCFRRWRVQILQIEIGTLALISDLFASIVHLYLMVWETDHPYCMVCGIPPYSSKLRMIF